MIKRNTNVKNQNAVRRLAAIASTSLLLVGVAAWGISVGVGALREIWLQQFRVQDPAIDVVITSSGAIVQPEVITLHFGLTNGANLATIPYEEKRASLIKRIPNIRDISIERRLPRRVTIDVKEREPAVRVAPHKGEYAGLVADYDGVVFRYFNGGQMPIVRESAEVHHEPGQNLEGQAAAAIQLVRLLADAAEEKDVTGSAELAFMRVLEVDTSNKDYLLVTLGDYSTAEIAWERMGENSEIARKSLRRQLVRLAQAINARITPRATRWIATEYEKGGRVYAADPARVGGR